MVKFSIERALSKPVIDHNHPMLSGNKYGFEGGTAVKIDDLYHLVTAEMVGDPFWMKMRFGHWHSKDAVSWTRVGTLFETTGEIDYYDTRASLWSPMVIYNTNEDRWNMFYVAYRQGCIIKDAGLHMDGKIWRATSQISGMQGIGGPYKDVEIVLQPDAEKMHWEGQQGTDSFYPYEVDGKWYALYGSHNYKPVGPWLVGLARAEKLAGRWKRCRNIEPLMEKYFIENPIVTKIGDYLVAVYDSAPVDHSLQYLEDGYSVGYSCSKDGINWEQGSTIEVQEHGPSNWAKDIRTPLCLIDEGDNVYLMLYTGRCKAKNFWGVGLVRLKLEK